MWQVILMRSFFSFNRAAWTVTVCSQHGRTMNDAMKYCRLSIKDDSPAALVTAANGEIDAGIDALPATHQKYDASDVAAQKRAPQILSRPPTIGAEYSKDDVGPALFSPVSGDRL